MGIRLPNDPSNLLGGVLYSVPLDGTDAVFIAEQIGGIGTQVRLNSQGTEFFFNARVAPNDPNNEVDGLLRRDIDASNPSIRVDTQPGNETDFVDFDFGLTDNDSHAIYSSRGDELYAANLSTGNVARLDIDGINPVLAAFGLSLIHI